jgi:hypothetical protein
MELSQIRQAARSRGLSWAAVQAAYWELKEAERAKRQRSNEVRQSAWMLATASTPGCWPFWRHGFWARWGHKLAAGSDFTVVPGYDEIGQEMGGLFPEYSGDDGTERLFGFLFSPYDRMPSREELYQKALDRAEYEQRYARSASLSLSQNPPEPLPDDF